MKTCLIPILTEDKIWNHLTTIFFPLPNPISMPQYFCSKVEESNYHYIWGNHITHYPCITPLTIKGKISCIQLYAFVYCEWVETPP